MFQYRGSADEIIDAKAEENARTDHCKAGIRTEWQQYPGDHAGTDLRGSKDVTAWFTDRFTTVHPRTGQLPTLR